MIPERKHGPVREQDGDSAHNNNVDSAKSDEGYGAQRDDWRTEIDPSEKSGINVREKSLKILGSYYEMLSGRLGRIYANEQRIILQPVARPAHQMPNIQGPEMHAVTQTHVEEQLRAGVTEPVNREWASTVVFAPK